MRPRGILPRWATDDEYTSGPDDNQPNKLEPTAGEKAQGYRRKGRPPARKLNWLLNRVCEWVGFSADFNGVNWHNFDRRDNNNNLIDLDASRVDGTVRAIYSEVHGFWIVPGRDTDGTVFMGESGEWRVLDTFYPHRIHIAVEGGARVAFFNSDEHVGGPPFIYSEPLTLITDVPFITDNMPVPNPGSNYRVMDAAQLPSGRVLAVGAGDAKDLAWYSDDGCVTWTTPPMQINTAYIGSFPRRIIPGADGKVVVIGDGDKLWQSNDDGETWAERDLVLDGIAAIKEGVYLPGFDLWLFTTTTSTLTTQDPLTDSFVTTVLPGGAENTNAGLAANGDAALFDIKLPGLLSHNLFLSRDAFTGPMIRIGKNAMAGGSHPVAFTINKAGQFLMASRFAIRTSLRGVL